MTLIDADKLKEQISVAINSMIEGDETEEELKLLGLIKATLDAAVALAPTVEAEPVRHGKWDENAVPFCNVCQECGAAVERHCVKRNGSLKRCPNCGAYMDVEEEEDETNG